METDKIRITPEWSKNKEQVWTECFEKLEDTPTVKKIAFFRRQAFVYAAAVIGLILLSLPTTAFFYTKHVDTLYGEHKTVVLPDGSAVEMNADSRLTYKPLWWMVSRNVELQGEAYFEIKKGSRFDVCSHEYTVSVLGTSFNIFVRDNAYNVSCISGKVKVSDKNQSVILTSRMQTKLENRQFVTMESDNNQQSIGWTKGQFSFTAVPLNEVIKEIERQYNIQIERPVNSDYLYTGTFPKTKEPKQVLQIVGKPFGLNLKIIE